MVKMMDLWGGKKIIDSLPKELLTAKLILRH